MHPTSISSAPESTATSEFNVQGTRFTSHHTQQHPSTPQEASESQQKEAKARRRTLVRRYLQQQRLFRTPEALPSKQYAAKHFFQSVGFALEGLMFAFQQERNLRIHVGLLLLTAMVGVRVSLQPSEWAMVLLIGGFLVFSELANTTLEWLVDLLTGGAFDLRAKHIKDVAAGACLVVSLVGYGVLALVFWPYVSRLLPLLD